MMQWFDNYRSRIVGNMYRGEPFGPDQLTMLWPLLVGSAIFAALDLGLGLTHPARLIVLAVLVAPGVGWFGYLAFHTLKAFLRWRAHTNQKE